MNKENMLFAALREFTTGLLNQLLVNLAGQDGQIWLEELKKFLRKEPCWIDAVKKKVEEVKKNYLRSLFVFNVNVVTRDVGSLESPKEVFKTYFDPDFGNSGIIFSGVIPTDVAVEELIQNGRFSDFLGTTAEELEKRRLLGGQFLAICRDDAKLLCGGGYANFFVLTKGDELVAEDLSNVFVARVSVHDGGELGARLDRFRYDDVWYGDRGPRVFSQKQL